MFWYPDNVAKILTIGVDVTAYDIHLAASGLTVRPLQVTDNLLDENDDIILFCILKNCSFFITWPKKKNMFYLRVSRIMIKHKSLDQCSVNCDPLSSTLAHHYHNIESTSAVWWILMVIMEEIWASQKKHPQHYNTLQTGKHNGPTLAQCSFNVGSPTMLVQQWYNNGSTSCGEVHRTDVIMAIYKHIKT